LKSPNTSQQEQLHALSANGALANAGNETIQPCQYNFPVTDFPSAILLAQTFTDVVLGTLPGAQAVFASDGGEEAGLVPLIGAIIGQEGEQVGYYRALQKKIAAAAPCELAFSSFCLTQIPSNSKISFQNWAKADSSPSQF
jgi:hypothetical protein